jgi:hypothetical protein
VIANADEYRITKEEAQRFEEALAAVEMENQDLAPRLRQAMREGLESQLQDLRAELAEYEARVKGPSAPAAEPRATRSRS